MAALSALLNRPIVSMTTLIVISLLIVTLGVECRPSVPSPQEEVVEVVAQSDPSIEALHDGVEEDHVRGRQQFGPPPPQQQSILSRMSYSLSGLSDELTGAGSSLMDMMSRFGSSGFGGFGGGGGSGYDDYGCPNCGYDFNTFIPAFVLVLASLFFLLATTTAAQSGRRKRSLSDETDDNNQLTDLLDAPTWMSMVEELWNEETEDACTLKALCRMNRLAIDAPGSTGIAVSISSLPLSYLLHRKYDHGFMSYLDASLMGRNGVNCTTLYSSCPRLN